MKTPAILLTLLVSVLNVLAGTDSDKPVSGCFFNMPVFEILKVHGSLSGTPVAVSEDLSKEKAGLTFTIDKLPKHEALRVIERELAMQAGVEVVRAEDGTLVARKIATRK